MDHAHAITDADEHRLDAVRTFADRVLDVGRDRWSGEETPLFVDGVTVDGHEPVVWRYDDEEFIVSNLASQQQFMRTLRGLSALTGEDRYESAARAAVRYHFDELVDETGLLRWGGHQFVDLATLEPVGHFDADTHEFKCHFPDYDLCWQVDPDATRRMLRAVWNAHVLDWEVLDMNRHGAYGQELPLDTPWEHPWTDPDAFFAGRGLSFINIGADLVLAAGQLARLDDDDAAWTWGRRLAHMYERARHPNTGLGAYQYSKPERREPLPDEEPMPTYSRYGDRAENQFGEQFGDVAREGWVCWGRRLKTTYVQAGTTWLWIGSQLGDAGEQLLEETAGALAALYEHAYDANRHAFRPMWADGTDLTGKTFAKTGYYGEAGTAWHPYPADAGFLRAFVLGYEQTTDRRLWHAARAIATNEGIGSLAADPQGEHDVRTATDSADPDELAALLALYRVTGDPACLDRARSVGDTIVAERFHDGFFLPSPDHVHARFDAIEPLVLLALDATLRGRPEAVPAYLPASPAIHGRFDGHGRTYDRRVIWSSTR